MRCSDYIQPEHIFIGIAPAEKRALLEDLVHRLVETGVTLDENEVVDRLMAREGDASTGLGHGMAVPHTMVDGLTQTILAAATCPEGTDYDALDGEPSRVIFLMLNPATKMGDHIRMLARLARLASRTGVIEALAEAKDTQAFLAILREDDDHHLAS